MANKEINFKDKFLELMALDVNEHTEKLNQGNTQLTYLSWVYAIAEATKADPDFEYEIVMHDGKPYIYDELTGYMVTTKVTMFGKTKMMWLPVMDSNNRAMKSKAYDVVTKFKTITVAPATMFDVNKTIMRCLTKNLAMFGLGLYIFAGEDLPKDMKNESERHADHLALLSEALNAIEEINSRERLNEVWNKYSSLQSVQTFMDKLAEKGKQYPKQQ